MTHDRPEAGQAARPTFVPRWLGFRSALILVAVIAGALLVGRWSASLLWPSDGSADAGFVRDMIAHHNQAVEMADIVRVRTEDAQLAAMTQEIVLVQQLQIGRMFGWLDLWGVPLQSDRPRMAWMGHEGMTLQSMPGMASYEEVRQLEQLPVPAMEEQFLRLMIRHHQGGVQMAEAGLERADRAEVRDLARTIQATQKVEIGIMQDILAARGLAPEPDLTSAPSSGNGEHGMSSMSPEEMAGAEAAGAEHAEGFTSSVPGTVSGMVRFGPALVLIFAVAALVLAAVLRRRGMALPAVAPSMLRWQALAVGGLLISAVLHGGLVPEHLREGTWYGIFFAVSAIALALAAAAVLVRPSRPVSAVAGALALALLVIWAVFRIVPPPGLDAVEGIDLVGLVTKAAELAALAGCIALWRHPEGADPTPNQTRTPRERTRRYARVAS